MKTITKLQYAKLTAKRNKRMATTIVITGITLYFLGFVCGAIQNNTVKDYFTSYPTYAELMRG